MTFYSGKFYESVLLVLGQFCLHELHSDIESFIHTT